MKTRISMIVLMMVAATTLVAATEAPFVERHVIGFNVSLLAAPPSGVTNYLVKERPPFGDVGDISHGGSYDPVTRTILFGPFEDSQSRTLTYADSPPDGSYGRFVFSGEAVANGISSAIVGDDYTEIPPFPPLSDVRLLLRWRPLSKQVAIQLMGGTGAPCFILASTNLQDWVSVGDLGNVFQGFELVDAEAPNHPCRFYRAQTIPPPPQLLRGEACLRVIGVSGLANPQSLSNFPSMWLVDVAASGGHAYVADYCEGLKVIDVSSPAKPQQAGAWQTTGMAWQGSPWTFRLGRNRVPFASPFRDCRDCQCESNRAATSCFGRVSPTWFRAAAQRGIWIYRPAWGGSNSIGR